TECTPPRQPGSAPPARSASTAAPGGCCACVDVGSGSGSSLGAVRAVAGRPHRLLAVGRPRSCAHLIPAGGVCFSGWSPSAAVTVSVQVTKAKSRSLPASERLRGAEFFRGDLRSGLVLLGETERTDDLEPLAALLQRGQLGVERLDEFGVVFAEREPADARTTPRWHERLGLAQPGFRVLLEQIADRRVQRRGAIHPAVGDRAEQAVLVAQRDQLFLGRTRF